MVRDPTERVPEQDGVWVSTDGAETAVAPMVPAAAVSA